MEKAKLYIVGTPIGNMKDITLRAIETLKLVDIIACEDTRQTRKLLSHYEITGKKLIAYHDKNEKNSAKGIIELVEQGTSIAVVSDAGMPVIADPGFEVIRQARAADINIEVIPGPSAQTTVAAISGLSPKYSFIGFLNPKTGKRKNELSSLGSGTYVTYVSPYKLESTLLDIQEIFGDETRVFLAKELTKMYEKTYFGTIVQVYNQIKNNVKGEYTLAFEVVKND
ncbi:16S rRNA (cytidine(1402)-2'-O)-methyltransferase [Mycoplasma marinum]|uniref:16S rRNA (cytidine(1402)-2'-O)-methyltransferase n=1 Tax=Mycoplasma marinum TaxID=1937190 RepID=UPI00104041B8|nr:16S rRNA (cytidine(1402)-2'-O)-methyltransferase [Mycoplasma marinum]